jgi:uncharacterized protein YhaN
LDFSDSHTAFHLVYGPNEAGKSTALRALRNMLFGIPTRTPDSFRHPHPKLRIGAELIRSDGEKISLYPAQRTAQNPAGRQRSDPIG